MIIKCPYCKQRYNVMNSSRGEVVTCQSCNNSITLPEIKDGEKIIYQKKNLLQRIRDFGYSSNEIESNTSIISEAKTVEIPRVIRMDSIYGNESKLMKCPGCGKDVSKAAKSCPHCGQPLGEEFTSGGFCIFLGAVFGLLGLAISLVCYGGNGAKYSFLGMMIHFGILLLWPNI